MKFLQGRISDLEQENSVKEILDNIVMSSNRESLEREKGKVRQQQLKMKLAIDFNYLKIQQQKKGNLTRTILLRKLKFRRSCWMPTFTQNNPCPHPVMKNEEFIILYNIYVLAFY